MREGGHRHRRDLKRKKSISSSCDGQGNLNLKSCLTNILGTSKYVQNKYMGLGFYLIIIKFVILKAN